MKNPQIRHIEDAIVQPRGDRLRRLSSWLVVALICVAIAAQVAGRNPAADESSGATLALQKNIADDTSRTPDVDASADAVVTGTGYAIVVLRAPASTASHLAAAYLAPARSAIPRAPPPPVLLV